MRLSFWLTLFISLELSGCGGGHSSVTPVQAVAATEKSAAAKLGEQLFSERLISSSGRMSCATCHDPAFSHGPPNANAVQVGGVFQTEFGLRAAPSLRYLERQPPFSLTALHGGPQGGLMADGRADTLAAQTHLPLLNPQELDSDAARLLHLVSLAPYDTQFRPLFGAPDEATVLNGVGNALQAFQLEDTSFHPYDSKYDQVLAGREQLTAAEARGLVAFEDPKRGNCAACHTSRAGPDGKPPLFTNFGYAAVGVPRNADIPANEDSQHFDLGLCQRPDLATRGDLCGFFRTPSLRNTARRPVYFHNGKMTSLVQVLDFYATRDTEPGRWYPAEKFDDLPPSYRANVSRVAPLDGRPAGSAPALNAQDLHDMACFLVTLNDGHVRGTLSAEGCR